MDVHVVLKDFLNNKPPQRIIVNDINPTDTIDYFKRTLSKRHSTVLQDIDVIYGGNCLQSDKTLTDCGIKNGSTIYVLNRGKNHSDMSKIIENTESQVHDAVKNTLAKSVHRQVIENILSNPITLQSIVDDSPGLSSDPVCLSLLRDSSLIAIACKPENLKKVLAKHPSFGPACLSLASLVTAHLVQFDPSAEADPAPYSVDMSDDEDSPGPHVSRPAAFGQTPITADQFRAALASAQQGGATPPTSNTVPSATPTSAMHSRSRQYVSSSDFMNAIRSAQSTSASPNLTPTVPPPQNFDTQLATLRSMGITDETVAKQALLATNGDVNAALEIIFSLHADN